MQRHTSPEPRRATLLTRLSAMAALLALVLLPLAARAQRTIDRRFAVLPTVSLRVYNLAGSVKITGWDRDTVTVSGQVNDTKGAEFFMGFGTAGGKLGIWSETPTDVKPSSLELRVPKGAQVWVKTASADVIVTDVTGGVDINSVTGRITVHGAPSELYAETMGGNVDVDAATRFARLKTASGDIHVRGAIEDITTTTVSGALTIEGDHFVRGSFESVDGNIRYLGDVARESALEFINHSGDVEFLLPAGTLADFSISTYYGSFDDHYGVQPKYGGNKLKGREISFSTGGGGGQVTVRNFKGKVILRRRS